MALLRLPNTKTEMGESELERDTGKHVRSHIQKGKKKKNQWNG